MTARPWVGVSTEISRVFIDLIYINSEFPCGKPSAPHPSRVVIFEMIIRKQVSIAAQPEVVWDVITDLRHAFEWAPGFEDYPYISADWPNFGATAVWRCHAGPLHLDFNLTLTRAQRGQLLHIANSSVFGSGLETYAFNHDGGSTTIAYEASSRPNWLGRLFAVAMTRKLERQMDRTIANLKRYCERRSI